MLTYITTYCDNPEYLEQVLDTMQQCPDERLKLIVVDDCSDVSPIELINARSDSRISLYRITEDLGFNSHGGRNLAMKMSTTEWNLLVDIDFRVTNIENIIEQIANGELETTIPHFFAIEKTYLKQKQQDEAYPSVNDFLVTKTTFWKAGGYDPEFYGWHHGDRALLHRMVGANSESNSVMFGSRLQALRSPLAITKIDPDLVRNQERYSEDRTIFYISPECHGLLSVQEVKSMERHKNNTPIEYLPFQWEQLI